MQQNRVKYNFIETTIPYIKLLYNYVYLITGDYGKATKLVFKTYREAHGFYNYLSPTTDIKLWLFNIINNISAIINNEDADLSGKANNKELNTNIEWEKVEGKLSRINFTDILPVIFSLPYKLRKIIALYVTGELDLEEIAEILDVPGGVVYKRLFDARTIILKKLAGDDINVDYLTDDLDYSDKKEISEIVEKDKDYTGNHEFNNVIKLQQLVKETIDTKLIKEHPPEELESSIREKFSRSLRERLKGTNKNRRYVSYISVIMFVLITVLILIIKPSVELTKNFAEEQTGKNNLLVQLQKNYTLLKNGKLNDKIVLGDSVVIVNYLTGQKLDYPVSFYRDSSLTLEGCFISKIDKKKFALFLYKSKKHEMILLFPVPVDRIKKSVSITLSKNLLGHLLNGNCYSTVKENFISLLKSDGNNIFAFATDLPAKNLILEICKQ